MKAVAKLNVDELIYKFGFKQFLPSDVFMQDVAKLCDHAIIRTVCTEVMYQIMGKNPTLGHNLNLSRLELMMWNVPAGTSVKNMAHWGQLVRENRFGMYNYGKAVNLQKYGQEVPPDYDLSKIKIPVATFTGGYDVLADPMDVEKLQAILSDNEALVYSHKEEVYDHADFIIGLDAHERIYPIVLQLLQKYNKPKRVIY
jgi:lysosomal acid lipase/cholesteryl ester hydrolase